MPISKPNVTLQKKSTPTSVANADQKILIIGGKVSAGTAVAGKLCKDVQSGDENTLFGAHSMVADMVREFFKINTINRVDVISLDDADGAVKAAGVVTFSGVATVAGTIIVYVGSKANRAYSVPVIVGQTAAQTATALAALITADATAPFTAAADSAAVTITMTNAGTEGNFTLLKVDDATDVVGISWTLTAFTSGATNPTMTTVLDVVGDTRYQTIVAPCAWGTTYLTSFLDDRWNVANAIRDGVAIVWTHESLGDAKTAVASLNSKSLVFVVDKLIEEANHKGPAVAEFNYAKAAQFAAIRALRLTSGADISDFVTNSVGALDSIGGPAIASLPYFNTPMARLPLIEEAYANWLQEDADELRDVGATSIGNNIADTSVIMAEVVTTYKTDVSGVADTTWKYLETVDSASQVGEYIFNNLKSDYKQTRLTTGDLIANRAMANEDSIRASMVQYYNELSGPDYVLLQSGEDALNYFKKYLTVTINMTTGTATITARGPLTTQLRNLIVPFSFVLTSVN